MCYTEQTWVPTLLIGLETFLGGMETSDLPLSGTRRAPPLETFLGGMETALDEFFLFFQRVLETFLGGMETALVPRGYEQDGRP